MPDDTKAFNEVRALLSKMDRSIDEARSKRVGPKDEPLERGPVASENRSAARSDMDRQIGGPRVQPTPQTPIEAKRAQYGRARPLNGSDQGSARIQPESAWKSPKNYDDLSIG